MSIVENHPITPTTPYKLHHRRRCPRKAEAPRFDEETIKKMLEMEWWHAPAEEIENVKEMEFRVGEYVGKD